MCVALEKEQVVAGFINRNSDGMKFTIDDVDDYISSLWNAGCGPIRLNFKQQELRNYLDMCDDVCLKVTPTGYVIDKTLLSDDMTEAESAFLHGNKDLAKSFDLFCRLQVDIRTPYNLLDEMGFRFLYA